MLSHIYRVCTEFERSHGCRPNLLYLNKTHLAQLLEDLSGWPNFESALRFLDMELVLSDEVVHPHVAAVSTPVRRYATC